MREIYREAPSPLDNSDLIEVVEDYLKSQTGCWFVVYEGDQKEAEVQADILTKLGCEVAFRKSKKGKIKLHTRWSPPQK